MIGSRILRASLLIPVATTMLLAQGDTGGIRGTILDPSSAVIPGAAVTATKADTGVTYPAISTESGSYAVRSLRAGVYTVEVEQSGFKKLLSDNVVVTISSVTQLDLTLEVGATTETVVVAALPTLKKETADVSTAIDPTTWLDLPLNASGTLQLRHSVAGSQWSRRRVFRSHHQWRSDSGHAGSDRWHGCKSRRSARRATSTKLSCCRRRPSRNSR